MNIDLDKHDVITTAGELSTGSETKILARLIYKRFGKDPQAAASGWRRLMQNNCTDREFMELVEEGLTMELSLRKLGEVLKGNEQVMSTDQLNYLIDQGHLPDDVVSIPNPNQCGILDKYLVGKTSCPTIASYRRRKGYE